MGQSVDLLLQGQNLPLQQRAFIRDRNLIQCSIESVRHGNDSIKNNTANNFVKSSFEIKSSLNSLSTKENNNLKTRKNPKINVLTKKQLGDRFTFLYAYGINTQDLCSLIKTLNLPIIVTREIQYADGILALSNLIKNNKLLQISRALKQLLNYSSFSVPSKKEERIKRAADKLLSPLEEVRLVIEEVIIFRKYKVDLLPRTSRVRRLQHEIVKHYHLTSISIGNEPNRRVRIYPNNEVN